jgi:subtilisin family serine protease
VEVLPGEQLGLNGPITVEKPVSEIMKFILYLFIGCVLAPTSVRAQFTKHVIYFTDKGTSPFSFNQPDVFLSQRALDRRTRYNIALDSTDLPVTPRYVDSILSVPFVQLLGVSKWLNAVAIETTNPLALSQIQQFPFVQSVQPIALRSTHTSVGKFDVIHAPTVPVIPRNENTQSNVLDYGASEDMITIHNAHFLHNLGFSGNNMQIALLDAGFLKFDLLPSFDSINLNNRVLETWDFVKQETTVAEDHVHGMQCLSTIAAYMPGTFVGSAPNSAFYLYRTEDAGTEYPIELFFLAMGYERADSAGSDVTSTSLGYSRYDLPNFDHTYADMDGNTTIAAIAADLAAKKGMLMVVSAGNEGGGSWHYITTPADADSVLCVGAVNTLGEVAGFSSYGPSSDGQIKPSVAAVGWGAMVASHIDGTPYPSNGTSFSGPYMAGVATCLWQAFPEVNNMDIINVLQESGNKHDAPDDRIGYGIPDVKKSFAILVKRGFENSFSFENCRANFQLTVKQGNLMNVIIERKLSGDNEYDIIHTFNGANEFIFRNLPFTDDLTYATEGLIKYRISMNAGDTTFVLDSLQINHILSCAVTQNEINIIPNPITDVINIHAAFIENADYTLRLFSAAGQQLQVLNGSAVRGRTTIQMKTQWLSKGIYYLKIFINNKLLRTETLLR